MVAMAFAPIALAVDSLEARMGMACGGPATTDIPNMQALMSASPVVLGIPSRDPCDELRRFVSVSVGQPAYNMLAEWNEGFRYTDAVKYLRILLAQPDMVGIRAQTVDLAYREIYGRASTPIEQASWEVQIKAQKAWYASIVGAELKKLNASQAQRRLMLDRVYQAGMGRNADDNDRAYWLARPEHFRLIVEANRTWLYSANGVNDLVQTVTRALTAKSGKAPSDAQIKAAMMNYTGSRLIYSEMIKS